VRLKLTLSYAGVVVLAGGVLVVVARPLLLRRPPVPPEASDTLEDLRSLVLGHYELAAFLVLAVLLVVGLVGGWFLAGRMLAPLYRITDATRLAAKGSLGHRIALEGRNDEFRELADSFDTMLARLESHVAEQQRFAANASHELRTPLATTQALLDVARRDPDHDEHELVDRLQAINTRAIDLTEALLVLSRADQRSFTAEPVDLSLVAEEAAETLLPLAEARGVTVRTSGEITPTVGSPALLLQMTTNLLHNAIVHNLPADGTVEVSTEVRPDAAVLTVENTGEKLTPQVVSTLTEPFQRGAARTGSGVGLGLAIVDSITRAHDGTLTLAPRPDGGIRVTARLPA
jgi:two-component system sensor histidine kinase VanS